MFAKDEWSNVEKAASESRPFICGRNEKEAKISSAINRIQNINNPLLHTEYTIKANVKGTKIKGTVSTTTDRVKVTHRILHSIM